MNIKQLIAATAAVFVTGHVFAQQTYSDVAKMRTEVTEEFGLLAHTAVAGTLGEHPAVTVARAWGARGIDPNTFIVLHPANLRFPMAPPTKNDNPSREQAQHIANAASASK